jgi:hypothetical protein
VVSLITPSAGHAVDLSVNLLQDEERRTTENCRVTAILLDRYESFGLGAQLRSKGSEDQISPTVRFNSEINPEGKGAVNTRFHLGRY